MSPENVKQIEEIVAAIRAEAYREGWRDALKALRKAAQEVRYACPVIELPDQQGFAGLPEHLHPRTLPQGDYTIIPAHR